MAYIRLGGRKNEQAPVSPLYNEPVSPLGHSEESSRLLFCGQRHRSSHPVPLAGHLPATLAGTVVQR
jgi:hypothetical protein